MAKLKQPWTIWITGLSGSGKTTISKELIKLLDNRAAEHEYIRLDEIRQLITPNPKFTREERELVYRCGVYTAELLNRHGISAIIDSVDGDGYGRELAKSVLNNFYVVWIDCPLEVCMERERNRADKAEIVDLYQRAKRGEIKLAGFGYDYIVENDPLLKIDSTQYSAAQSAKILFDELV